MFGALCVGGDSELEFTVIREGLADYIVFTLMFDKSLKK